MEQIRSNFAGELGAKDNRRQVGRPQQEFRSAMITSNDINRFFTYHKPTEEDRAAYGNINDAAKNLALVILHNTPASADQSDAIRKVREASMTANAAIACNISNEVNPRK